MWSDLQDQSIFHCSVKGQMTVHIHTLKIKGGE